MASSSNRPSRARFARAGRVVLFLALAAYPAVVPAQNVGNRIWFDSLQLSALSIDNGRIRPAQAEPARVFGITADYGRLSRTLRLRLEVGYWESRLTDAVVRTFTDSLHRTIIDPSRDDSTIRSRVRLYDVILGLSSRWLPMQTSLIQPFVGAGVALHVINAKGPLIDGTFVERLFDAVSAGPFAEAGFVFKPLPRVGIEARLRGDLLNSFRSHSVRAGGIYYFGPLRSTEP